MNGYQRYLQQATQKASSGDKVVSSKKRKDFKISPEKEMLQQLLKQKQAQKKEKQKSFPFGTVVFLFVGLGIASWGYLNHENLEKFLSGIDISATTKAVAEEKPETSKKDLKKKDIANSKDTAKSDELNSNDENLNQVNFDYLKNFQERKKQLDFKEEELQKLEQELVIQKKDLDKKFDEIENIRKQISAQLEERVKADEQKIETLVQVYTQMKAPQAAKVFETLDDDLAVEILTKMKKKSAADILNLLKADRAQMLSEKFAGYKSHARSDTNRMPAQTSDSNKEELKNNSEDNKSEKEIKKP